MREALWNYSGIARQVLGSSCGNYLENSLDTCCGITVELSEIYLGVTGGGQLQKQDKTWRFLDFECQSSGAKVLANLPG